MFKLISISAVAACNVRECAYNAGDSCHAKAITIGDGDTPMCDTYFKSARHSEMNGRAGVGACKVSVCRHNRELECSAERIEVSSLDSQVTCMTFAHI